MTDTQHDLAAFAFAAAVLFAGFAIPRIIAEPAAQQKPLEVWCESGEETPSAEPYAVWESTCKLDNGVTTVPIRVILID